MTSEITPRTRSRIAVAVVRELGIGLLFLALAILATWPLIVHPSRAVSDPGDPFLNAWLLDWVQRAALENLDVWDAPMFHPAPMVLAFSENLFGVAWPLLPLRLFVANPILLYNIAVLLAFAMSGYCAFVLARMVTGSFLGGMIGGIFFAMVPWRFDHLAHLQHLWAGWLPLLLAATLRYLRRPDWLSAVLFGGAFVMNGLTNMHWFAFGSIAVGFALVAGAVMTQAWRSVRFWIPITVAGLVALALLVPVIHGYSKAGEIYELSRSRSGVRFYSATWADWLAPAERNQLYGDHLAAKQHPPERALFPGLLVLVLSWIALRPIEPRGRRETWNIVLESAAIVSLIYAWWTATVEIDGLGNMALQLSDRGVILAVILVLVRISRGTKAPPLRRRLAPEIVIAIVWIGLGLFASFGLKGSLYSVLFDLLDPLRGIRVPARFAMIAYTGLAVTAAAGGVRLISVGPRRQIAGAALLAILVFELNAAPIRWYLHRGEWTEAYAWLREAPFTGAVFEMPVHRDPWYALRPVLNATQHGKSIVNGYSGYEPPHYEQIQAWARGRPIDPRLLPRLAESGTSMVIVHGDELEYDRDEPVRRWLRESLRSGEITFVRRFDEGIHGAWIFAITRTEPLAAWWRERRADPAGHTPVQNLERFLDAKLTWSSRPMGHVMIHPVPVTGPLRIWGWASAPAGIREVLLHFDNERITVAAPLVPRGDVERLMPWSRGKSTGFEAEFDRRPEGVHLATDLVVEIVTNDGERGRLEQIQFLWNQ